MTRMLKCAIIVIGILVFAQGAMAQDKCEGCVKVSNEQALQFDLFQAKLENLKLQFDTLYKLAQQQFMSLPQVQDLQKQFDELNKQTTEFTKSTVTSLKIDPEKFTYDPKVKSFVPKPLASTKPTK